MITNRFVIQKYNKKLGEWFDKFQGGHDDLDDAKDALEKQKQMYPNDTWELVERTIHERVIKV